MKASSSHGGKKLRTWKKIKNLPQLKQWGLGNISHLRSLFEHIDGIINWPEADLVKNVRVLMSNNYLWKRSYWKPRSRSGGKEIIHTDNRYRSMIAKLGKSSVSIIAT